MGFIAALIISFCGCTNTSSVTKQAFYFDDAENIGDYDKIREDIFYTDHVHLNPKGYGLFMDFIRELLDDLL